MTDKIYYLPLFSENNYFSQKKLLGFIDILPLSGRTYNALHLLKSRDFYFVGDLLQIKKKELLKLYGFGKKSLEDLENCLKIYVYCLEMEL